MSIHWQIMFDLWSLSVSQSIRKKTNLIKNIFEDMLFFHISNNLIYWNIFSLKLLDGFRQRNLSEIMKLQKKSVVLSLFKYMLALPRNMCSERIWHAFLAEDELEEMEWAFILFYFHVWQLWNKRVR